MNSGPKNVASQAVAIPSYPDDAVRESEKPKGMTIIDPKVLPQTHLTIGRRMAKLGECPSGSLIRYKSETYLVVDDVKNPTPYLVSLPSFLTGDPENEYDSDTVVEIIGFLHVTIQ